MTNKNKIYINIAVIFFTSGFTGFANSEKYQTESQSMQTPAPISGREFGNTNFSLNGYEAAPYPYGYAFNLPNDGNWRWIEPRCYNSAKANTCVEGHWVRKEKNKCEQVSQHTVRQGNYIRIIKAGNVSSCRE